MHRTPEPRFTFTVPSIHDDLPLNGRIYHPECIFRPQSKDSGNGKDNSEASREEERGRWQKKGIVMAHPYAPMGGSYDDRVVGIVTEEFLKKGWVVGTFNFRGAHASKGRTSWSGKPELDDYISFAAFFIHYLSSLRPGPSSTAVFTPDDPSPIHSSAHSATSQTVVQEPPIVILGGYSYGSIILRHLPPIPSILNPFSNPLTGSAADEILLRAHKLADQINLEYINLARSLHLQRQKLKRDLDKKRATTMGGEETSPDKRRSSREIKRSIDGGRRTSLDIGVIGCKLRSLSHRRNPNPQTPSPPQESTRRPSHAISMPEVRYLFISPITPPMSALAAPALTSRFVFWNRLPSGTDVFAKHDTLMVFGNQDIFSSVKKVRDWVGRMVQEEGTGTRFQSCEVAGAGHFWHEEGVERELRGALARWEIGVRERRIE